MQVVDLVFDGGCHDRGDHSGGNGGQYIIAVDFSPLISFRWRAQMVFLVFDAFPSSPVFVPDLRSFFPLLMVDVMVVVIVVVVISYRLRVGGRDHSAEK